MDVSHGRDPKTAWIRLRSESLRTRRGGPLSLSAGVQFLRHLASWPEHRCRLPCASAKQHTQGVGVLIADLAGNGFQRQISCAQQMACTFDPEVLDESNRRGAHRALDAALQGPIADADGFGGVRDVDRPGESFASPALESRDGWITVAEG